MRAPAPSFRPTTGAPTLSARSISLWIFSAKTSPRAPPKTVKSWLKTNTLRPSIGPPPGDDTVGVGPLLQARGVGAVAGQQVELLERAGVEQVLDALPGQHLALGVLALDRTGRAGLVRLVPPVGAAPPAFPASDPSRRTTLLPPVPTQRGPHGAPGLTGAPQRDVAALPSDAVGSADMNAEAEAGGDASVERVGDRHGHGQLLLPGLDGHGLGAPWPCGPSGRRVRPRCPP